MATPISRATLTARYKISGPLMLDTALHLGGGRNPARGTDSPILRDGFGKPYLPGSSVKGALRAAVERIAPNITGVSACGLYAPPDIQKGEREAEEQTRCLTPLSEDHPLRTAYRKLEEAVGQNLSKKLEQEAKDKLDCRGCKLTAGKPITEEHLVCLLDNNLCDACKAFGAPFISSAIYFHDVPVDETRWIGLTQVRDGVGIDRDSGRAVDRLKYDYEIVPPDTVFNFSMTIESGDSHSLALAALALHELKEGNVPLGGIRSRGLGRCHLEKETTTVEVLDFENIDALKSYLSGEGPQKISLEEFIQAHINGLWQAKEEDDVQATAQ